MPGALKNMTENIPETKNAKRRLPRKPGKSHTSDSIRKEFHDFIAEQTAKRGSELRSRMAAARVKDLLEHQLAMLRLTRQMNKLLGDLNNHESKVNKTSERGKKSCKANKSKEYVIFSGGPKGLEYTSLTKSDTGTFRMEIDVTGINPESIHISTENKKIMHVKALTAGVRRTLKIVSPDGIDIDDIIIHYPKHGILVLEAP